MHSKFDLISGLRIYNEKLIIIRKKYFFSFFSLLFLLFFLFGFLYVESVQAAVKEDNQLIEKVSKDYTKKFCNSIAFGLSKESAMEFSAKENNLIFRNRKGFDDLRNVERDQEGLPKTGQKGEHPAKTNRLEVMS